MEYAIFCDESRHLEYDKSKQMVLGAILCNADDEHHLNNLIKGIKRKYHLNPNIELKWTKVSKSKLSMYKEIVDLIRDQKIFIRLLIANKENLNHGEFNQTHEDWYYKMYYILLFYFSMIRQTSYKVYIDIKDNNSSHKASKLNTILQETTLSTYTIKPVRSHEKQLIQVIDMIIGAAGYKNQGCQTSLSKLELIKYIEQELNVDLKDSTSFLQRKINIFMWNGQN